MKRVQRYKPPVFKVWETRCGYCHVKSEDMYVLTCHDCQREGCPECMPAGRGCICPQCEEREEAAL